MTKKKEIIIFAVILAVLIAVCAVTFLAKTQGNKVSVTAGGESKVYPLDKNTVINLPKNTVIIENGEVYVAHADCPRQICVNTGKISAVGEQIACLPNEVLVEIIK